MAATMPARVRSLTFRVIPDIFLCLLRFDFKLPLPRTLAPVTNLAGIGSWRFSWPFSQLNPLVLGHWRLEERRSRGHDSNGGHYTREGEKLDLSRNS